MWPDFGSGESTGVASVRSIWKLPQCSAEPVPDRSRIDPLLARAGPVRKGGNISGVTNSRRIKSCCAEVIAGREEQDENL